MQLQVYVRHPDETSMLIDTLSDQEEAITLCHDLVVVDGYERAEIWSEDGERLYCVERREGASLHTVNELDRTAMLRLRPLADARPADEHDDRHDEHEEYDEHDDEPGARRGDPSAGNGRRAELPPRTPGLPRILGEQPGHEERWLGL